MSSRVTLFLVAAGLVLSAGCSTTVDGRAASARTGPVAPCLNQPSDAAYFSCLQESLNTVWGKEFDAIGRDFPPPQLTAPDTSPRSADFDRAYFSSREGIHMPTRYLDDVESAFGARARIVLTFTMGHENGHHVQQLLHPQEEPSADAEMQADCYAGVWARAVAATGQLDVAVFAGDAEGELRRLSGDAEEVRTHGGAEERVAALERGLAADDPSACDVGALTWPGTGADVPN